MIFFDIDNTLIDYDTTEKNAVKELFGARYNISLNDEQARFWHTISKTYFNRYLHGELKYNEQGKRRFCEMTKFCGIDIDEKEGELLFCDYRTLRVKNWVLFDDVNEALELLKKFRLGIISNGNAGQQKEKLLCTDIADNFELQIFSEDIGKPKPCADIFLEAVRRSGEKPEDIIYVGDNFDTDIAPCEKIGIRGVLIDRKGESDYGCTVNSLRELVKLIKKAI